jgi:hypothetical protein
MKSAKHIPTLLRPTLSAFAAVGMLISIVGEVSAQEIGACLKDGKLDQVTVGGVPTCKDNETPIVWNQAGPQGPQGEPGPAGPASVINRHLFVITGQYEVPVGYADYHLLLTAGSFEKQRADTDIKVTLIAHADTYLATSNLCYLQLRMNGFNDMGSDDTDVLNYSTGTMQFGGTLYSTTGTADPFAITTIFSGNNPPFNGATGTFDVEIWGQSDGPAHCRLGGYDYRQKYLLIVEEVPATSGVGVVAGSEQ